MSIPSEPRAVKLIVGLFLKETGLIKPVSKKLEEKFGAVDIISPWFPFNFTGYYTSEMGFPLFRRLLVFKRLVSQDSLVEIKLLTNEMEKSNIRDKKRQVNIDPGYVSHERFVLATGKNFTHRIYLGEGIFADLTLIYTRGSFQALPWTYPDYKDPGMLGFLETVRSKYIVDLKRKKLNIKPHKQNEK